MSGTSITGWQTASTEPDAFASVPGESELAWRDVELPVRGGDDADHWFRARFDANGDAPVVSFPGLATICDVFVDGVRVLRSNSMFLQHSVPVSAGVHELAVCARALAPVLAESRKPRARWRTRVVANGNLRWIRTSILGRAPGFAPAPAVVGPWRPVDVLEREQPKLTLRTYLDGRDGVIEVRCREEDGPVEVQGAFGTVQLPAGGGHVQVTNPALWWPHTHGEPERQVVHVRTAAGEVSRWVGFRQLTGAPHPEENGLDLHVNGVSVFVRGVVWTPIEQQELRPTLERICAAGMNLVRVVGTTRYESDEFHDLCDELGLLVWQDLMFANMDYPFADPAFTEAVELEVRQLFESVGGRPSLAVVCGNSEIEQQVAMLGLDPSLARGEFFMSTVPALMRAAGVNVPYLPSAPCGGALPFRTDRGVVNYFGVGAYLRPLEDVRRAEVRFASECLAFANVPDDDPDNHSQGVMRDVGADWDFADVRDHYLRLICGREPGHEDYWPWARLVTGELMAAVFGEWRRAASPCGGGVVLWSRDLVPGAGWGIIDSEGRPKLAWHVLRRALAPVAVWFVDEGLNGLRVHLANDTAAAVRASLRVAVYRPDGASVATETYPVNVKPHTTTELDVDQTFGFFADLTYAYRFGPAQHAVVVASLERDNGLLSQAFFYPAVGTQGRRADPGPATVELRAVTREGDSTIEVEVASAQPARCVRLTAFGYEADDDGFDLEPGRSRRIVLRRVDQSVDENVAAVVVRAEALNLEQPVEVVTE